MTSPIPRLDPAGRPSRRLRGRSAAAVVLSSLVWATACGDDSPDRAEADEAVCVGVEALAASVQELSDLDPTDATRDDYASAISAVRDARNDLADSAADVAEADWDALEREVDDLVGQLQEAPDDQAVAEILEAARPQAEQVRDDIADYGTVVCE